MGLTVPERDVEAVSAGIERILDDKDLIAKAKANMAKIAAELSWDLAVEPLVDFCKAEGTYATPASRRKLQAYTRGGMYYALKSICKSPPLHG